jgi:membrane protease YdiL (CAAX protease family)
VADVTYCPTCDIRYADARYCRVCGSELAVDTDEGSGVALAEPVRRRWGMGDVLLAFLCSAGFTVAAITFTRPFTLDAVFVFVILMGANWLGWAGWTVAASHMKGSRSLRTDFGLALEPSDLPRGIVGGFGTLVIVAIVAVLLGTPAGDPTISDFAPTGLLQWASFGVALVIGAPIAEELFFRGLFLRAAERRLGTIGGVALSTTIFALLHVPQRLSLGFAVAFIPIFVIGLVLAVLAVWSKRLGASIVAHMTVNGLAFVTMMASQTSGA